MPFARTTRRLLPRVLFLLVGLVSAILLAGARGCARSGGAGLGDAGPAPRFSVLVFSKTDTAGYRHASIPDGIRAVETLGRRHYFAVDATEDASVFTSGRLGDYDAVVFLNTSGDVLDASQQAAFEDYIRAGGGFVGVHGASATEYDWTWYGGLVGAFFDDHPAIQEATVRVEDGAHSASRPLPNVWSRTDEWYNFRSDPTDSIRVLLTLDETSYEGGTMGARHPIAWVHEHDGGRAFYTALGHTRESYSDPLFLEHLRGGIEWAAAGLGDFVEPGFPFITTTVDARGLAPFMPDSNVAVRGIALSLGNGAYAAFDPDLLRMTAGWTGDFLSMMTMAQVSYHQAGNKANRIPAVVGEPVFGTGLYPGWTGRTPSFADPRVPGPNPTDVGRGPLPDRLGHWNGLYIVGDRVVLSYTVQGTNVLEQPGSARAGDAVGITRAFQTEVPESPLTLVAAEVRGGTATTVEEDVALVFHDAARDTVTAVGVVGAPEGAMLEVLRNRYVTFRLPAQGPESRFTLVLWTGARSDLDLFRQMLEQPVERVDFRDGGPAHWPRPVATRGRVAPDTSAYAVDRLTLPLPNPWKRNVRVADLDFFPDGRAALVTFSGDVWLLSGIDRGLERLVWRRFASGLYEPLSLSIVEGTIYVYGREGIVRLNDLNDDGEADFYESFTDEIIQSIETREWPLDMVERPGGGFYVSMGGALNAGPATSEAIVPGFRAGSPHSGAVLEVSQDGNDVSVYASGFREPFLGIHPETGFLTASDQQGNFVPSTPIYTVEEDGYYGVPATWRGHGAPPEPVRPLTWIPHRVDPSGAGQVWITGDRMGPLDGALVHLSYARPGPFRVYVDTASGIAQGGVAPLPGHYATPTMKGQVHPSDGRLYVAGFRVWGTRTEEVSRLIRLRYTGRPGPLPAEARAGRQGVVLRFSQPLDAATATEPDRYTVARWTYRRTSEYGSGHFTSDGAPGQEILPVAAAYLSDDRKTVLLVLPDMREVMQMQVDYALENAGGDSLANTAYLTINDLGSLDLQAAGFGKVDWQNAIREFPTVTDPASPEAALVSARRGRHLYQEIGCVACHSLDGSQQGTIGPTFQGLSGSERPLAGGSTVAADEAYLRRAILDPSDQIVAGYEASMPSYRGSLSEADVTSLVRFIQSLSAGGN